MSTKPRSRTRHSSGTRAKRPSETKPSTPRRPPPSSARVGPDDARRQARAQRVQERRHAVARQAQIERLKRRSLWGGGIIAALLIIFLLVHSLASGGTRSAGTTSIGSIPGVVTYSNLARTHVSGPVTYTQNPPVGGPHDQVWLNCGIYTTPVRNENAVHSLEHGAVWVTYQPGLPQSAVQQLVSLVSGQSYIILSPYPGLPAPVVASAWGVQLKVQTASDPRIAEFIQKYANGLQAPEPGGECSGGTGSPAA